MKTALSVGGEPFSYAQVRLVQPHFGVVSRSVNAGLFEVPPGGDLFSHSVARAVSSALGRFTSVFGMGTGGATPLEPPGLPSMHYFSQPRKGPPALRKVTECNILVSGGVFCLRRFVDFLQGILQNLGTHNAWEIEVRRDGEKAFQGTRTVLRLR